MKGRQTGGVSPSSESTAPADEVYQGDGEGQSDQFPRCSIQ